jgi:hypothetical protein
MNRSSLLLAFGLIGSITQLFAQTPPRIQIDLEQFIERLFPIQDEELDYESIYEVMLQVYLNPISINDADAEVLQASYLLNPTQIANLISYRNEFGPFISLYELQAIPDFDLQTIHNLVPFLSLGRGDLKKTKGFLERVHSEEQAYLLLRHRRTWETRKGFSPADTSSTGRISSRYLGDPNDLYVRFRIQHSRDFSLGLTLDKDAGEQFILDKKNARYGFNFLSFHLTRYEIGKWKTVSLGDFQVSFGQGLVYGAGYGFGKGSETISTVRRSSVGITPYTAALEFGFFRGLGATYSHKNWQNTWIFSYAPRDGRVNESIDTLDRSESFISSFSESGLHRTLSELSTKNRLRELSLGSNLQYTSSNRKFHIGGNLLSTKFDRRWQRTATPYNQFEFSGTQNSIGSIYSSNNWRNFHLFGEVAMSQSGGTGAVLGFISSLSKQVDISFLWRNYDRDFHSFYGNAFAESTRPINERGAYVGIQIRPNLKWKVNSYFDLFRFPWLRYRAYSPSSGQEWLTRISYQPDRNLLAFFQIRNEKKDRNIPDSGEPGLVYRLARMNKTNGLISLEYQVSKALFIRSRVLFSSVEFDEVRTNGFMILQDAQYSFNKFRFTGRIALFDTDDYENRQYTFENNVLWTFSLPANSGQGMRYYLLGQYQFNSQLTGYFRFSRTNYTDRESISSGLQAIPFPHQTETTFLLRYMLHR